MAPTHGRMVLARDGVRDDSAVLSADEDSYIGKLATLTDITVSLRVQLARQTLAPEGAGAEPPERGVVGPGLPEYEAYRLLAEEIDEDVQAPGAEASAEGAG